MPSALAGEWLFESSDEFPAANANLTPLPVAPIFRSAEPESYAEYDPGGSP